MFNWLFGKKEVPKEPSKPRHPQDEEKNWMYEALLQFLISKEWKITILNFVDNNCVVFDNEEENKFEYTLLHNKFKELIAGLFDSVMADLGMDQALLLELIDKGLQSKNKKVLEQLLYVEDFQKFKGMMLKRNAELEREALQELSNQKFKTTQSLLQNIRFPPTDTGEKQGESEEELMKKVMRISLQEEEEKSRKEKEDEEKHQVQIREALQEQEKIEKEKTIDRESKISEEKEEQEGRRQREAQEQERKDRLRLLKEKREKIEAQRRLVEGKLVQQQKDLKERQESEAKKEQESPPKDQTSDKSQYPDKPLEAPGQSIEQRKRRLMQQRQILRQKKMSQRQLQLQKKSSSQTESIVLGESGIRDVKGEKHKQKEEEKISEDEIERRRQLMKKIKNKIVEDF